MKGIFKRSIALLLCCCVLVHCWIPDSKAMGAGGVIQVISGGLTAGGATGAAAAGAAVPPLLVATLAAAGLYVWSGSDSAQKAKEVVGGYWTKFCENLGQTEAANNQELMNSVTYTKNGAISLGEKGTAKVKSFMDWVKSQTAVAGTGVINARSVDISGGLLLGDYPVLVLPANATINYKGLLITSTLADSCLFTFLVHTDTDTVQPISFTVGQSAIKTSGKISWKLNGIDEYDSFYNSTGASMPFIWHKVNNFCFDYVTMQNSYKTPSIRNFLIDNFAIHSGVTPDDLFSQFQLTDVPATSDTLFDGLKDLPVISPGQDLKIDAGPIIGGIADKGALTGTADISLQDLLDALAQIGVNDGRTKVGAQSGAIDIPISVPDLGSISISVDYPDTIPISIDWPENPPSWWDDSTTRPAEPAIPSTTPDIPDITPGDITDTMQFDMVDIFPFCIPWDMQALFNKFRAEPVAPRVSWPFSIPAIGFQYSLDLDFSAWSPAASVLRIMERIGFLLGLCWVSFGFINGGDD